MATIYYLLIKELKSIRYKKMYFSLDVLEKDAKFSESEFKSFLKNIGEDESGRPNYILRVQYEGPRGVQPIQ